MNGLVLVNETTKWLQVHESHLRDEGFAGGRLGCWRLYTESMTYIGCMLTLGSPESLYCLLDIISFSKMLYHVIFDIWALFSPLINFYLESWRRSSWPTTSMAMVPSPGAKLNRFFNKYFVARTHKHNEYEQSNSKSQYYFCLNFIIRFLQKKNLIW